MIMAQEQALLKARVGFSRQERPRGASGRGGSVCALACLRPPDTFVKPLMAGEGDSDQGAREASRPHIGSDYLLR
jgi:hypothetical protein